MKGYSDEEWERLLADPPTPWRDDFAVFILTHGRPEAVRKATLTSLLRSGYSGRWYLVLDTTDKDIPKFRRTYGEERVLIFDKAEMLEREGPVEERIDLGDNRGVSPVVVFARNATDRLAEAVGVDYYLVLDDDYIDIAHRYAVQEVGVWRLPGQRTWRLDQIIDATVEFLESDPRIVTVAWGQGGDYIGGAMSHNFRRGISRKAMNTFIIRRGRPVRFSGRINEDVTAYVTEGSRGELFFTLLDFCVVQEMTQQNKGGLTEEYLSLGTYQKSFYSVMYAPSCVSVAVLRGESSSRVHHAVNWDRAVPKILSDAHRRD